MNEQLPTSHLKEYGIMSEDNTFSKKLSNKDIENFLKGHAMIADNGKDRLIFLLTDNNTRLNVNIYQRDKTIDEIVKQSQKEIVYSQLNELTNSKSIDIEKKAFIYDQRTQQVTEYDLLKHTEKIAQVVAEKKISKKVTVLRTNSSSSKVTCRIRLTSSLRLAKKSPII